MGLLGKVQSGIKINGQINLVYGPEGVGKTTIFSTYPNGILADVEEGSKHLNVNRLMRDELPDYAALISLINELTTGEHSYETFGIDSITALEAMMSASICGTKYKSLSDIPYGGGVVQLEELATGFMGTLRKLATTRNMNVFLIGHTRVRQFTDPTDSSTWSRYSIQCNEKFADKLKAFSDNVWFLRYDIDTYKDSKTNKTVASSSGKRILHTAWSAAYDAKSRLALPNEVDVTVNGYEAIKAAAETMKPKAATELVADIKALMLKTTADNRSLIQSKLEAAGDDVNKLIRLKTKATEVVSAGV
jgi:hypothetical protein